MDAALIESSCPSVLERCAHACGHASDSGSNRALSTLLRGPLESLRGRWDQAGFCWIVGRFQRFARDLVLQGVLSHNTLELPNALLKRPDLGHRRRPHQTLTVSFSPSLMRRLT